MKGFDNIPTFSRMLECCYYARPNVRGLAAGMKGNYESPAEPAPIGAKAPDALRSWRREPLPCGRHHFFENFRFVFGQVGEHLAVKLDIFLRQRRDKRTVFHAVFAGAGIYLDVP